MELGPLDGMTNADLKRRFFSNAASTSCRHPKAEAITTVDGEHVGYLCPDCDTELRADWSPLPSESAAAAHALIAAGYDPRDAAELTRLYEPNGEVHNGHTAQDCPARVEVTNMSDPSPQYMHGNCD